MLITSFFAAPTFIEKHQHSGETVSEHAELVTVELESDLQHQTNSQHHVHSCGMCHMHGYATSLMKLNDVFAFERAHVIDLDWAEMSGYPSHQFRPPRA
ncbi:hypothetical protein [Hirschia baltica]|nr:hypothetical protein [Hirschia baltica]